MGVQKRFLIYRMYPKIFGGPSMCRGDTNEGLNNLSKGGCVGILLVELVTCEFSPTQHPENP